MAYPSELKFTAACSRPYRKVHSPTLITAPLLCRSFGIACLGTYPTLDRVNKTGKVEPTTPAQGAFPHSHRPPTGGVQADAAHLFFQLVSYRAREVLTCGSLLEAA